MRLIHWTNEEGFDLKSTGYRVEQDAHAQREFFKPHGLWVSDEDDLGWHEWCTGEGFRVEHLQRPYEVRVKPDANVLYLKTEGDLTDFTAKYGRDITDQERKVLASQVRVDYIDWPRVMLEYDGIVITPYQWNQRMELMWYYPWDCASGCIWNLSVIESFEERTIKDVVREKEDA